MRSLPKPNRVRKESGFEIVGMVWTREETRWERHMLRRFRASKSLDWSKMTYVDADDSDVCMACLSQKVIYEVHDDHVRYRCLACEVVFRIIDEPDPPPQPKRLPPGSDDDNNYPFADPDE